MFGAMFRAIAGVIWLVLLIRNRPSVARCRQRHRLPPRDTWKLLEDLQPPTREEIERYVPEACRNLGPDWIFTRARVLTFSEIRKTRLVGSVGGFDVAEEFEEEYSVYRGVYGYSDHRGAIQTFEMPPTENDRAVRPGRSFIVCFDRRSPRVHHLFRPVRLSQPVK